MKTVFLLMAMYDAQVIIPIEVVCADFFAPLTLPNLMRKISAGDIALPLIRMEPASQKTAKGVHIQDFANFIDARRAAAVKECEQLCGVRLT
ncbi:Pyocin activator protein PrtN [Caballeronia mineralivorans PML1(12)]|uniref:Pyocin activator protein PrtN n=2 Tax=Caballeronia mineralivorans TaxID=2010198 RepID=A0A0J1CN76_9BURK|nr:pyocin activator PrtN family protein [Caballeronia mineralivorans]KLU21999.1 Pyocin activator protein PrtN [Caballeronia mineralivorans PML1(12)]